MQYGTLCHIFLDYETSPSVLSQKSGGKSWGNREKPGKKREILGTISYDWPEQLLLLDFFDYLKKTFPADSGRSGSPRANLRPFLDFG